MAAPLIPCTCSRRRGPWRAPHTCSQRPPRRIEALPYVAGGSTINGDRDFSNPFDDGRNFDGRIGADIKMGKRATLFADYRYRFIRFGDEALAEGETGAGAFGLPGVGSLIDVFRMSHEGAMWTGGVVINF